MEDNKSRKWLYDKLSQQGLNVGKDYAEFDSLMQNNEDSRKWVFKKAGELGYNIGKDYDEFDSLINPVPQKPAEVVEVAQPVDTVAQQLPADTVPQFQPADTIAAPVDSVSVSAEQQAVQVEDVQQSASQEAEEALPQVVKELNKTIDSYRSVNPITLQSKAQPMFNEKTGKLENVYGTLTGQTYSDPESAHLANRVESDRYRYDWESTTEEGRAHAERRFKEEENEREQLFKNELNSFDSFWQEKDPENAAEKTWADAAKKTEEDNRRTAERVYGGSSLLNGGREMHRVNAGAFQGERRVNYMKNHDLDTLFDNAWENLGEEGQKEAVEHCYNILRRRYPYADKDELKTAADEMARQQSDQRMYNLAVEKNMPKDNLEYLMKKIAQGNSILQLSEGLARSSAGTTGDMAAAQMADQIYGEGGENGWERLGRKASGIGGMVLGFAADPLTTLSAGAGSMGAKGTAWVGGKVLAGKAATSAAVEAATRQFATSNVGRILTGMSAGAGNFGAYEFAKEGLNQWQWGGHINPETGENEGYSFGEMLKSGEHGTLMGAATGWITPAASQLSNRLAQATKSTAGKMAVRTGQFAGTVLTEGTIFSIPEWIEGKRDAFDVWTDNQAMMLGFKGQHLLKTGVHVIGDMFAKEGRAGFETRLRKRLDGNPDLALTKDDQRELDSHGYGDLKELMADKQLVDEANAGRKSAEAHSTELSRKGEQRSDQEYVSHLQDMMNDTSISEAARAKMYYLATGRMLPMSTVVSCSMEQDGDNGYIGDSIG